MKIVLHPHFKKAYKKRIAPQDKLVSQTRERIAQFQENPHDPIVKDHALSGAKEGFRAFSVTGDIRIVYLPLQEDEVVFVDIGSHNQVY